ncbi:UDP-N-acetylmuramate--L-alanine ligase [Candidatus Dependentiae bacterium]|nr:UDP-N-acetylmuramate--L-alanine ligase [Candidatus Dependentiae bacterium]
MFLGIKNIHFVGIGGSGMCGIAEILHNLGFKVTGSDLSESETVAHLRELGIPVFIGHSEKNLGDAEVLVKSTAVPETNPEIQEGFRKKIPVIRRAEMLGELMRLKEGIAVAGTHGKTTTTSMVATIMHFAKLDPTIIIGGRLSLIESHAKLGKSEFLVAEADESDGSFLSLLPSIGIITNIDNDHLDFYESFSKIKDAFISFANNVPFYGFVCICLDCENIQEILPHLTKFYITYGIETNADFQARDIKFDYKSTTYNLYFKNELLGGIKLQVPGKATVLNSLAAIATSHELGINFKTYSKGISKYQGLHRRMEFMGKCKGAMVFNDYGHHPTEVKVTLQTFKQIKKNRLIAVFQPHRYSRTKLLLDDFGKSFYNADILYITDIYPAGEKPIRGISGKLLAETVKKFGFKNIKFISDKNKLLKILIKTCQPDDIILFLGAGDIWKVGLDLIDSKESK